MRTVRNSVQLIGRLGSDPEMKTFDSGNSKLTVNLATNDSYKDKEGKKITNTQWHRLVAWGPKASFMEKLLKKGSEVAIIGKIEYRSYEAKNGDQKNITEIKVDDFQLLGAKPKGEA